jgi:4-amino-4-deoxy-L-arabinose transferase-like glycosyltransferase
MFTTGNYLVPSFNGQLWADKPILVYWLMSVSIKLFGANEFAAVFGRQKRFWVG